MKMVRGLLILLALFMLSGCKTQYPAIQKNTPLVITVNIKDMSLSFINLKTKLNFETWELEKAYTGGIILPNQDTLALYGKQVESVDLFSLSTGKLIQSWNTGKGLVEAEILRNNKEIVFSDQNRQSIRFFNLKGTELKEVPAHGDPLTLLESKHEDKLFVVSYDSETMVVIDSQKKEKVNQFPIHTSAAGALLNEKKHEIWIGGHGAGSEAGSDIHIYNWESGEQKKKITAPLMPINLLEFQDNIYALSHGSSTLYRLSVEGELKGSVTVGANPFELSSYNKEILVAGYDSNDVTFLQPETLKALSTVQVGKGPFQMIIRE